MQQVCPHNCTPDRVESESPLLGTRQGSSPAWWNPNWGHGVRGPDYAQGYDRAIRCWIPEYDALLAVAAERVALEASLLATVLGRRIRVLEVGAGTGTLADLTFRAEAKLCDGPFIGAYCAVDSSPHMLGRVPDRLLADPRFRTHLGQFGPEDYGGPFDLLTGCLSFHDLVGAATVESIAEFFAIAERHLEPAPVGVLMADIFLPHDSDARAAEVLQWQTGMRRAGMSDDEIMVFLSCNPEMLTTAHLEQLATVAEQFCYGSPRLKPLAGVEAPFRILSLRRLA